VTPNPSIERTSSSRLRCFRLPLMSNVRPQHRTTRSEAKRTDGCADPEMHRSRGQRKQLGRFNGRFAPFLCRRSCRTLKDTPAPVGVLTQKIAGQMRRESALSDATAVRFCLAAAGWLLGIAAGFAVAIALFAHRRTARHG
jgi:hypothetical protein